MQSHGSALGKYREETSLQSNQTIARICGIDAPKSRNFTAFAGHLIPDIGPSDKGASLLPMFL